MTELRNGIYHNDGTVDTDAVFSIADARTACAENGYVNDPNDPGGETKYGISRRTFPTVNIKSLTPELAQTLRRTYYWTAPGFSRVAEVYPDIAISLYDLSVNCGQQTAVMMLQRGINVVCEGIVAPDRAASWRRVIARITNGKPLVVDGKIGAVTLSVMRKCPYPVAILMALKGEAYIHYKDLDPEYRAGWLNRLGA